ncbi:MAG: hypothetical protein JNJ73_06455 [Hyphomonadaceae bacterium]|nr:hypothetical protein [Hyphomonadaceae bacterium]
MRNTRSWRAAFVALLLAACSSGSEIASPGATNPGTAPGGGGSSGGGSSGGGSASCPSGTTNQGALGSQTVCQLSGAILTNLSLPAVTGVVYRLNGRVDVGQDVGAAGSGGQAATLSIAAGVTLYGDEPGDMLIINRGSRIQAVGTASAPIIFTSREDVLGQNDPATASRQWGGLILLGRAPIRGCNTAVAQGSVDCQNAIEGVTAATGAQALYGGAVSSDNSGTLQYVQVRYPGAFLTSAAAGDDLNGISLGGVGSGTTIDHVQVHNSGDDGIEVFGGAVNMKYVAITGALDDSLDYDEGWQGAVQFLVIRQTALTGGPDRLVEASNRVVASTAPGTVQTNPTISNFTMVGLPTNSSNANILGIDLNNTGGTPGSSGRFLNGVVTGSTTCLSAQNSNGSPAPRFDSTLFDCAGAYGSVATTIINAGANNSTATPTTLNGLMPGSNEIARTAVNPTSVNSFFSTANYVGAFSPTETATTNWASGWTLQLFTATGCPAGTTQGTPLTVSGASTPMPRCLIAGVIGSGSIPASVRLTQGNLYQLQGRVDVGVDRGAAGTGGTAASLTIDPGVTIAGTNPGDMIIVNRGSQIFVNGTTAQPVIMTSVGDVANPSRSDTNAINREWGGLIVLGRAPIRGCNTAVTQGTVDCQNAIEGVTAATGNQALYGGATAADNSGRLNNLQIRYPGAFLTSAAAGDDLNGLTLGGVGSGTVIQNVQVHNSGDDGIEIFGGAVNMKNIVITGALDDSLDYDEGWTGKVQFLIIRQTALTGGPDRLVEASNRVVSSSGGTLNTNPTIANFTMIGLAQNSSAAAIRGIELNNTGGAPGSSGRYLNGVVTGSSVCLFADTANTSPAPQMDSTLLDCSGALGASAQAIVNAGTNNSTATVNTLTGSFINGANEAARTAINPNTVDAFFTATTWIGAVRDASDTWWQSWSCGLASGSTC